MPLPVGRFCWKVVHLASFELTFNLVLRNLPDFWILVLVLIMVSMWTWYSLQMYIEKAYFNRPVFGVRSTKTLKIEIDREVHKNELITELRKVESFNRELLYIFDQHMLLDKNLCGNKIWIIFKLQFNDTCSNAHKKVIED